MIVLIITMKLKNSVTVSKSSQLYFLISYIQRAGKKRSSTGSGVEVERHISDSVVLRQTVELLADDD